MYELNDLINNFENGVDTIIGDKGATYLRSKTKNCFS